MRKTITKVIAVIMAALMCLSTAACAKGNNQAAHTSTQDASTENEAATKEEETRASEPETYEGAADASVEGEYIICDGQIFPCIGRESDNESPFVYLTPYGEAMIQSKIEKLYGKEGKMIEPNTLYYIEDDAVAGQPYYEIYLTEECLLYFPDCTSEGGPEWFYLADGTYVHSFVISEEQYEEKFMFLTEYEYDHFMDYLDDDFVEYFKTNYGVSDSSFFWFLGDVDFYDIDHIPDGPFDLKINAIWREKFNLNID